MDHVSLGAFVISSPVGGFSMNAVIHDGVAANGTVRSGAAGQSVG